MTDLNEFMDAVDGMQRREEFIAKYAAYREKGRELSRLLKGGYLEQPDLPETAKLLRLNKVMRDAIGIFSEFNEACALCYDDRILKTLDAEKVENVEILKGLAKLYEGVKL